MLTGGPYRARTGDIHGVTPVVPISTSRDPTAPNQRVPGLGHQGVNIKVLRVRGILCEFRFTKPHKTVEKVWFGSRVAGFSRLSACETPRIPGLRDFEADLSSSSVRRPIIGLNVEPPERAPPGK